MKETIASVLSPIEKAKVVAFCTDVDMYEAVVKVLLAGIYYHGTIQAGKVPNPLQNGALSLASLATNNPITDEVLGQHIRGVWAGINALENATKALKEVKVEGVLLDTSEKNEAI